MNDVKYLRTGWNFHKPSNNCLGTNISWEGVAEKGIVGVTLGCRNS